MGLEILVTNDDGFYSKGINTLAELLSKYGNITVLAPKEGQSGKSVALTLENTIRIHHVDKKETDNGHINIYSLTGTPADCVKMAMNRFFKKKKPDLLVSGINHGSNASAGAIYSGTLGACAEGTLYGIPSIGFSLDSHSHNPDFSGVEAYIEKIIDNCLKFPAKKGVYLNINFPDLPAEKIKGIRFATQGKGIWINEFEERTDPHGRDYYWMKGDFINQDTTETADHLLLQEGYITIVPHKVDSTDEAEIARLSEKWGL